MRSIEIDSDGEITVVGESFQDLAPVMEFLNHSGIPFRLGKYNHPIGTSLRFQAPATDLVQHLALLLNLARKAGQYDAVLEDAQRLASAQLAGLNLQM